MDFTPQMAEALARRFHDAYERLAPEYGYETRPETRTFDPTTPNGRLMVAVCERLLREGMDYDPEPAPDSDLGGREALAHARKLRRRH